MRGKIKENLFIKVAVYLPFSFRENLNKARYSIYGNLLPVLAPKVLVLRRNKATNSSISTDLFPPATKTLVLGNLFKLVLFAITFVPAVFFWG